MPACEDRRDDGSRKREQAADAQIDSRGENDEGHAERDDSDDRDLPQDIGEIAQLQKDARSIEGDGADDDGEEENRQ